MGKPSYKTRAKNRGERMADYWPLLALVIVAALGGMAYTHALAGGLRSWMHGFMGFFLCIFALLKLFHPAAFADGFRMYDLLARRMPAYAYLYPLLELALGLSYLAFVAPLAVYGTTIVLLGFGAAGVICALRRGLDINCPCMGSVLDVPLSTVTLSEDLAMTAMAAAMLAMAL